MPPPPINPLVARARFVGTLDGQRVENVLHFGRPAGAPWTVDVINQFLADAILAWSDNFVPLLSVDYVFTSVQVVQLAGPGSVQASGPAGSGQAGGRAFDSLPNNCAACVTLRTGLAGRSFLGRTYLPGIPENEVTGSYMNLGYLTELNNAASGFRSGLVELGYNLGVYSQVTAGQPRPTGLFTPAISFSLTDGVIDSQRGRSPR